MSKNILFYSNYCNYSFETLNLINKHNMTDHFIYVCVDNKEIQIPSFIKVVPTLYITDTKNILIEDDISDWFNKMFSKPNLEPYSENNSFSYSVIDTNENTFSENFSYLGDDTSIKVIEEKVTKKDDEFNINKLSQQRMDELKSLTI